MEPERKTVDISPFCAFSNDEWLDSLDAMNGSNSLNFGLVSQQQQHSTFGNPIIHHAPTATATATPPSCTPSSHQHTRIAINTTNSPTLKPRMTMKASEKTTSAMQTISSHSNLRSTLSNEADRRLCKLSAHLSRRKVSSSKVYTMMHCFETNYIASTHKPSNLSTERAYQYDAALNNISSRPAQNLELASYTPAHTFPAVHSFIQSGDLQSGPAEQQQQQQSSSGSPLESLGLSGRLVPTGWNSNSTLARRGVPPAGAGSGGYCYEMFQGGANLPKMERQELLTPDTSNLFNDSTTRIQPNPTVVGNNGPLNYDLGEDMNINNSNPTVNCELTPSAEQQYRNFTNQGPLSTNTKDDSINCEYQTSHNGSSSLCSLYSKRDSDDNRPKSQRSKNHHAQGEELVGRSVFFRSALAPYGGRPPPSASLSTPPGESSSSHRTGIANRIKKFFIVGASKQHIAIREYLRSGTKGVELDDVLYVTKKENVRLAQGRPTKRYEAINMEQVVRTALRLDYDMQISPPPINSCANTPSTGGDGCGVSLPSKDPTSPADPLLQNLNHQPQQSYAPARHE